VSIHYIPYPSPKPWCGDFALEALHKHSHYKIEHTTPDQTQDLQDTVIHYENIQIIRRNTVRSLKHIEKLQRNGNKVIAGVRGHIGLKQCRKLIPALDAVACNIDAHLVKDMVELNPNTYMIPEGEDPTLFKPAPKPSYTMLSWIGRDHKDFKNADLLPRLGYPYSIATYKNYMPHNYMPSFLNNSTIHIVTSKHEGFCRPILEAALCGLPIITSNVGVAHHIVDPRYIINGNPRQNVSTYQDLIQKLSDSPETREKIGQENRHRAQRFSWKEVVTEYERMWSELT